MAEALKHLLGFDLKNECKTEYDFIIVGSGQAGSVLANRLSENGKYTVLVLEAGRDEARLTEKLPIYSTANVPQPGDFHWGQYTRGGFNFSNLLISRGFGSWQFWEKYRDDIRSRSITYTRYAGWGGCSAHNATVSIRNGPYNWNKWAALGLDEFSFDNIAPYYKLVENRSQRTAAGQLYYDPAIPEPRQGSFNQTYYGVNGYVPLFHALASPFQSVVNAVVTSALNTPGPNAFGSGGFSYPLNVDLDNPDTAALGGTSLMNLTQNDQNGSIIPPGQSNYVPFAQYNLPLFGDQGWTIPPELQRLNTPIPVNAVTLPGFPQLSGLSAIQRATAASTYLYPALARSQGRATDLTKRNINTTLNHITSQDLATIETTTLFNSTNSNTNNINSSSGKRHAPNNLHILSEVLVTNLILDGQGKKTRAIGVEYLDGYNIYQAGRNNHIERAGFGGTAGDARANAILSEQRGTKKVYARKEVILCGGFINTPQILLLSGIGDKSDLRRVGIKCRHHLPGVGKNIVDNQEVFIFWQTQNNRPGTVTLSAKSTPSVPATNFELVIGAAGDTQMLETADPFVQKNWAGLRNLGAVDVVFGRNDFNNLLNAGEYISNPPTTYQPFYSNPTKRTGMTVELEEDNRSRGFLRLVSKDPTVPPFIVSNFLSDPQDEQDFVDVFMNNVFPILLALGNGTNGTVATATTTVVNGTITALTLTSGGSGYTTPPLVFFAGAAGTNPTTPAVATAIISGGSVTGLTLVNGGSGFTGPVTVTLGAGFFQQLLDPSPADILKDGATNLTSINDVDITKLRRWLNSRVGAHHGGGSCKMGLRSDPTAVVNQRGQVYGIKGLRVCDMSVVPLSIRWPNINLYVIAEKFANDILRFYKSSC